jgi:hypothetical protein
MCGLLKTAEGYHRNSAGYPQPVCRQCHNVIARESARRLYRAERGDRDKAAKRWRYANDPEYRRQKLAAAAARWRRTRGLMSRLEAA